MKTKPKRIDVKDGSITVPIYQFADGRYCVDTLLGKTRKRITRASLEEAKTEARKLIAQIASGRSDEEPLARGETEDYRVVQQKLAPYGVSLLRVVEDWIGFHKKEAALTTKTVPDVVEELLTAKELEGVSRLHLIDRQTRLRRFANSFRGRIDTVTTHEVEIWLKEIKGSLRTHKNYRNALFQLFRYARTKGYLPKKEPTVVEDIVVRSDKGGKIPIYTAEEMQLLLDHAPEKLLPFFAIGAFAGLRTEEILRLEWQDIRLQQDFIEVSAAKSKTASRRLVPVLPILKKLLLPLYQAEGRVLEYAHHCSLIHARLDFCKSGIKIDGKVQEFTWKPNALRHSFASYRLAEIKDAARVALEMGNSPSMLFRNYRELVTEEQAKEWFALFPATVKHRETKLNAVA